MATVAVTVTFPGPRPAQAHSVRAIVEDVSMADELARLVAEDRRSPVSLGAPLTFEIDVGEPDERTSYAVRVHVDVTGDGRVSPGDFVSTQSHPVLTQGFGSEVTVPVQRVG